MAALADPQRRPPGLPQYNLSQVDSTPLVLKLQYAKYRGPLRGPRRNRLLRHHYPADGSFAALPGRTAGPRPQGHGQGVCKDCAQDPLSDLHAMVREFAKTVHSKGGKVVFVNFTKPPESSWGDMLGIAPADETISTTGSSGTVTPGWPISRCVYQSSGKTRSRQSPRRSATREGPPKKPPAQNPVALWDTKANGANADPPECMDANRCGSPTSKWPPWLSLDRQISGALTYGHLCSRSVLYNHTSMGEWKWPLQIPVEEKVAPSLFDTVVEAITRLCGLGSTNPRRPHPRPPSSADRAPDYRDAHDARPRRSPSPRDWSRDNQGRMYNDDYHRGRNGQDRGYDHGSSSSYRFTNGDLVTTFTSSK
ncbi:hypothetical protein TrVGV298_002167 [Trichoderma virens]|uniref:Uncharacterized protein n=1 Tax=Hypocrea virens (strain Gv29-8 / FGSC 10586) TaxID=413071 RepID=G9MS14_HYPVG|nr:hypothetical protein TRIVIDRAFT_222140 [Trichoderma virens Gv29-8]UKZ47932.1 hypothetical protein TrVGV298_002167 [Trichoderma virens]